MESTINQRFAKIRNLLRLSQKEMAKALDVRQASVSDIERERTEVNNKVILSLNQKYGVSFDWIYTGKGDIFIQNTDNATPLLLQKKNLINDNVLLKENAPKMGGEIDQKNLINVNDFNKYDRPKMGGGFGGILGGSDNKNDNDISRALILMLCSSYNKKNDTAFSHNSFSELASTFTIIAGYANFLQNMLEAEVAKEVFEAFERKYKETGETEGGMPEELDVILDKYIKMYYILLDSAMDGTSVITDLNGLLEMLRVKHIVSK